MGRGREALLEQEGPSVSALSPAGRGNRAVVKWRCKAGPDGGNLERGLCLKIQGGSAVGPLDIGSKAVMAVLA